MSSDMAQLPSSDPESLSEEARRELLRFARISLSRAVGVGGEWPEAHQAVLDDPCGVFVTLTKHGALRARPPVP